MARYEPIPEWDDDYDIPGDDDDDDNADQTGAFVPFSSSTPAPEFQTAPKEKSGLPKPPSFLDTLPKTPSLLGDLEDLPSLSTTTFTAEGEIYKEFPNADKTKIKFMMDRKGRTRVGLISPKKRYYNLLTQIPGKSGEFQINPQLPKEEKIINDENTPISEKEMAEKEIEEINEELNEIENEREIEAEGLSLRDRLREKVKAIFKKNGVTVTAIFLAAGVTIGAVIGAITNALKKLGTDLGNGVKTLGANTASALPGLIGAIVSFLFKAAGSAIGFLAEHTWLLILAVVAFLFQKLMKKR